MQYYKAHNDKIICLLCRHHCKLREHQIGFCGVNRNTDNKLENMVYGYPGAMNIDPVEKKPLYHFLPTSSIFSIGTVGCNFRCPFCQNWGISQSKNIDKEKYYTPEEIVSMAMVRECKSIAFTYNEPTIFYPFARDIALLAKANNIKTVFVSNGIESTQMIEDMSNTIDAINIDLKSFDEKYYKKELKGRLGWVLDNLIHIKKQNIWLEVTTLVIDGINSDSKSIEKIASFIYENLGDSTPWHLSAFHPDYKMLDKENTKISSLQNAYDIAKKVGLKYVYMGNVSVQSNTYCPKCNHELINRYRYNVSITGLNNGVCENCNYAIEGVFA